MATELGGTGAAADPRRKIIKASPHWLDQALQQRHIYHVARPSTLQKCPKVVFCVNFFGTEDINLTALNSQGCTYSQVLKPGARLRFLACLVIASYYVKNKTSGKPLAASSVQHAELLIELLPLADETRGYGGFRLWLLASHALSMEEAHEFCASKDPEYKRFMIEQRRQIIRDKAREDAKTRRDASAGKPDRPRKAPKVIASAAEEGSADDDDEEDEEDEHDDHDDHAPRPRPPPPPRAQIPPRPNVSLFPAALATGELSGFEMEQWNVPYISEASAAPPRHDVDGMDLDAPPVEEESSQAMVQVINEAGTKRVRDEADENSHGSPQPKRQRPTSEDLHVALAEADAHTALEPVVVPGLPAPPPSGVSTVLTLVNMAAMSPLGPAWLMYKYEAKHLKTSIDKLPQKAIKAMMEAGGRLRSDHYIGGSEEDYLKHFVQSYYENQALFSPSDPRNHRQLFQRRSHREEEESRHLLQVAFLVGDALTRQVLLTPSGKGEAHSLVVDPRNYYRYVNDTVPFPPLLNAVDDVRAYIDKLWATMPTVFQPGSVSPDHFPEHGRFTLLFDHSCIYPEYLERQVLPTRPEVPFDRFDASQHVSEPLLTAWVAANLDMVANNLLHQVQNEANNCLDNMEQLAAFIDNPMLGGAPVDDPDVLEAQQSLRQLRAAVGEDELREIQEIVDARLNIIKKDVSTLVAWVEESERVVDEEMAQEKQPFRQGQYPGLTVPLNYRRLEDARRERRKLRLRLEINVTNPFDQEEIEKRLGEGQRLFKLVNPLNEAIRAFDPHAADGTTDGGDGAVDMGLVGAPPTITADDERSNQLLDKADMSSPYAGIWSLQRLHYQNNDFLALRVIHEAEMASFESTNPEKVTPAICAARRDKIDDMFRDTLDVFNTSTNIPAALKLLREHLLNFSKNPKNFLLNPIDIVNGVEFDTAMTWTTNTINTIFNVTSKAFSPLLIVYFASRDHLRQPNFNNFKAMLGLMMHGGPETSKSWIVLAMGQLCCPGFVKNMAHISEQALTAGSFVHYIAVEHESQPSKYLDTNDSTGKGPAMGSRDANNLKAQLVKTAKSEGVVQANRLAIDKETGKPHVIESIGIVHCPWFELVNWDIMMIPDAQKSRLIIYEMTKRTDARLPDEIRHARRPESLQNHPFFQKLRKAHHLLHAYTGYVMLFVNTGAIRSGIIYDSAAILLNAIFDNYIFKTNIGPRKTDAILTMAGILQMQAAVFTLLGTRTGHAWLSSNGYEHPMHWEVVRDFIAPRLIVEKRALVAACTMMEFLIEDPHLIDVLGVMAHEMKLRPYIPPSEGHANTSVNVNVQTPRQVQSSGLARHEPFAPLIVELAKMAGKEESRAEVGLYPSEGSVADPNASLTQRLLIRMDGYSEGLVADYRYVAYTGLSLDAVIDNIVAQIEYHHKYQILRSYVKDLLLKSRDQTIDSPFYRRGLDDKTLEVITIISPTTGLPHVVKSKIPLIQIADVPVAQVSVGEDYGSSGRRRRRTLPKVQVGVAIDWLSKQLFMPLGPAHRELLTQDWNIDKMSATDAAIFYARMSESPESRLQTPALYYVPKVVDAAQPTILDVTAHASQRGPADARRAFMYDAHSRALVDIRSKPLANVISQLLSAPQLQVTTISGDTKVRGLHRPSKQYYLTFYRGSPTDVHIPVLGPDGKSTTTHRHLLRLDRHLQMLEVTPPSISGADVPRFMHNPALTTVNSMRITGLTSRQVMTTTRDDMTSLPMRYASAGAYEFDVDPDFQDALRRWELSGRPIDPVQDRALAVIGLNPHHTSWMYAPYRDMIARHHDDKDSFDKVVPMPKYPFEDVEQEIEELVQMAHGEKIVKLSSLLVAPDRTYAMMRGAPSHQLAIAAPPEVVRTDVEPDAMDLDS